MCKTRLAGLTACALIGFLSAGPVRADEPELFTALKHERLFAALELKLQSERSCGVGGVGRGYRVDSSALPVKISSLVLSVHPSRKAAEEAVRRLRDSAQAPDGPSRDFAGVGDLCYAVDGPRAGSLVFLRENIMVTFSWSGAKEDVVGLARRIDELIRTDREIAPRGRFARTPEIVSSGLPEAIAKGGKASVRPVIEGLGDRSHVTVIVRDVSQLDVLAMGRGDAELAFRAPNAHAYEVGTPVRVQVVAANEDNVFVSKEFSVKLTE